MSDRNAIVVDDVYFTYPDGREVLKGISCGIAHGEKLALVVPNGAGKSTFMSQLNGVLMPGQGRVIIDGIEITKDNLNQIRRKVGIVFQDPDDQLFCPTVFDDVAFGPLNLGLSKDEIHLRVKDALEAIGAIIANLVLGIRGASALTLLAAALVLGGIHGLVGVLQQLIRLDAIAGRHRNSDAGANDNVVFAEIEWSA